MFLLLFDVYYPHIALALPMSPPSGRPGSKVNINNNPTRKNRVT